MKCRLSTADHIYNYFNIKYVMTLFSSMARALHKGWPNQQIFMNTNQTNNEIRESTYALLVRSEEKERSLFETIVYSLFILSAVAAIWQFVHQPVNLPLAAIPQTVSATRSERCRTQRSATRTRPHIIALREG